VLEDKWLDEEPSRDIAVYLVWSAQLGARERNVADAATLMADPRVTHFWDGDEVVGKAFQQVLDAPAPVWDVWMLFPRDATWAADAPSPAWWEHQLGGVTGERFLDGSRFAAKAERLLARSLSPASGQG
jgi:hypothetical protein